jgi:hypothetical protein
VLLANLALGLGGTLLLAGAYTFHEGVVRVDEAHLGGTHVRVWVPATIVPLALHVAPRHAMAQVGQEIRPWLPTIHALTKEMKKYPETSWVDVQQADGHVRIRTHNGKLLIDIDEPEDQVHVSCPLTIMEEISDELAAEAPRA